jgi:uncharacterized membrane protein
MNTIALPGRRDWDSVAKKSLNGAATFWLIVALTGQILFIYFILGFYAEPTLHGNFEAWSKNKMLPHGYVEGDTFGNLMFAVHVLFAAIMTLGGTLQLIPALRRRVPALHRWSGRVYVATAITLAVGGLLMVWVAGRRNNLWGAFAISLDAVLIIAFAALALRYAIARDIVNHRRWALRLFMVANGVWFMRVGYMAWILVNQGSVGIANNGTGPFDVFWALGCFLLPLAFLELYLHAKDQGSRQQKFAVSGAIVVATVVMAIGIGGAYMAFWRPLL